MASFKLTEAYRVLGVPLDADESTIKRAYRSKAKRLHPDINPSSKAKAQFIELDKAYDYIMAVKSGKIRERKRTNTKSAHDFKHVRDFEAYMRRKAAQEAQESKKASKMGGGRRYSRPKHDPRNDHGRMGRANFQTICAFAMFILLIFLLSVGASNEAVIGAFFSGIIFVPLSYVIYHNLPEEFKVFKKGWENLKTGKKTGLKFGDYVNLTMLLFIGLEILMILLVVIAKMV